jgi:hypothetical protein
MDIAAFAKTLIGYAFEGSGADGGNIQDLAVKHGLLVETTYDPKEHGTDALWCSEPGDPWFVYSPEFKAFLGERP